ncbi:hypothetical protein B566_EDAN017874 [Ephemera danica]|nr:hypothetical protein B566_EDAN017874 [Ephemera danica]
MTPTSEHRCETCEKCFSTKSNLVRHNESVCSSKHRRNATHCCEICKKTFSRSDNLKRHLEKKACTRQVQKHDLYNCELCKRTFVRKDALTRHNKRPCLRSPKNVEVYTCDHCKKTLTSKTSLERHINDKVCQRTIGSTFLREKPPTDFQLPSGVEIKATAFNRSLIDYLLTNDKECKDIAEFFAYIRSKLIQLLEYELQVKKNMKVNMYLI